MGKKKDRRARERAMREDGAAPLAGIAAVVARQIATPAGRQVIAAGLMAAANAIAGKDARPPVPPKPPAPPVSPFAGEPPKAPDAPPSPYAGQTPEPPHSDAPALPPEVAKVIGSVAAGLERWAAGFGKPKDPPAGA